MSWKKHCPVDEDQSPLQRQAWRSGWTYRTMHGGDQDTENPGPAVQHIMGRYSPTVSSAWMQGYHTADNLKSE